MYFKELPGRPLLNLHHRAGLCTTQSRKTHARYFANASEKFLRLRITSLAASRVGHAVLHDTVEDTSVTFEDLADAGFSSDIITAVQALTKTEGESRLEAAQRAARNAVARQVKLADVADNMDLSRIPSPTPKDHARLEEYKRVRRVLLAGPKE